MPDLAWLLVWAWVAEYLLQPEVCLAHRGQWTARGVLWTVAHGVLWGAVVVWAWALGSGAPWSWPPWPVWVLVGTHLLLTQVPLFRVLAELITLQSVDRATEQALQLATRIKAPEMKGVAPAIPIGLGAVAYRLQEFTWHAALVALAWLLASRG